MKGIKSTLLSLGLVCVSWTGFCAQNTTVGTGAASANEVLLKATGPYEDLAHYILTRNDAKATAALAAAYGWPDQDPATRPSPRRAPNFPPAQK